MFDRVDRVGHAEAEVENKGFEQSFLEVVPLDHSEVAHLVPSHCELPPVSTITITKRYRLVYFLNIYWCSAIHKSIAEFESEYVAPMVCRRRKWSVN